MRPSYDVYNRLIWDPLYPLNEVIIGYMDRFDGIVEITLYEFNILDDPIPWHRIWYFSHNGNILWDREKRIDNLFVKK